MRRSYSKDDPKTLREHLLKVAPEKLVDLIFDLASDDDVSLSKVERLVSRPKDNSKRFLKRLKEIKNRGGFVPWKYSSKFADELSDLLADLESGVDTPEEGFDLICEFYESDSSFFEMADDSSGHIGSVFHEAIDIFVKYAAQISDKKMIIQRVLGLLKDDGYGVRDNLIKEADKFLSEAELRDLFLHLEAESVRSNGRYDSWKLGVMAKQLKDAVLFEKVARRGVKEPNSKTLVEIAEVYYSANDVEKAQEILDSIKSDDHFGRYEQEELQKNIYQKLGKKDEHFKIVYEAFKRYFSESTLRELLVVAGPERKGEFVKEAVDKILASSKWNIHDAEFLVNIDEADNLAKLIVNHRSDIQSGIFYSATEIAEYLVHKEKYLPAVILYRGLIAETLKKSIAKYYHHAVKYLEILDIISPKIDFWDGIDDHEMYMQKLRKTHALKKSLWSMNKG